MKRKLHRHSVHHKKATRAPKQDETYLVLVRSWVLVVMFAMMLAVGAITGTFLQTHLLESTPQVAGASTTR